MTTRKSLLAVLIVAALSFIGCGGGGSSTPVTVTISANASSVQTFQTVQFSATVTGTSNQAVTWSLSCTATATTVSACGTISASGTYVAPNTVPTIATQNSTDPASCYYHRNLAGEIERRRLGPVQRQLPQPAGARSPCTIGIVGRQCQFLVHEFQYLHGGHARLAG